MAALHRIGMTGDQIMGILRDAREAARLAVQSRVAAQRAAEKAQRAADNAGKEAAEAKKAADIAVKHVIEVRKQILLLAAEESEEEQPEQDPEQTVSPDADAPAVKPSSPVEPSPEGPPLMGEPSPVEPSPKGPPIPMGPPPMGPAMGPPMGPPQEGSPVDWPPRDRWDPIGDMQEFKRLQHLSGKSVPGLHHQSQSRSESVRRRMN